MDSDPTTVVNRYFSCMRARDPGVVELFHDDARLVGLGTERSGRDAIREFYRGVIEGAAPSPRPAGAPLAEGTRVAAEVYIDLADGTTIHAMDLFQVEEGRIRTLTYFLASH